MSSSSRQTDDELRRHLQRLRSDVDRVPMAGAAAARSRGRERTRRQVAGVSLGVAGLAVAVVAVGAGLGDTTVEPLPYDSPPGTSLDRSALLQPGDLPGTGEIEWVEGALTAAPTCTLLDPAADAPGVTFTNGAEPAGRISTAVSATIRDVDTAREQVLGCVEADAESDLIATVEFTAVEGFTAWYWSGPVFDDEREAVLFSVVRSGDDVVTVAQSGPQMDANGPVDVGLAAAAARRLCGAQGVDCPPLEAAAPPSTPAPDGWPAPADVADTVGPADVDQVSELRTDGELSDVCLPEPEQAETVEFVEYASSATPLDPALTLSRLTFADATAAGRYRASVPAPGPDCAPLDGDTVDSVELSAGAGGDAGVNGLAWRERVDVGAGDQLRVTRGIAQVGQVVLVATTPFSNGEGVEPASLAELLERAAGR